MGCLKPPVHRELAPLSNHLRDFRAEVTTKNRLELCVRCHRQALSRQTDVEPIAELNRKFGRMDDKKPEV